MTKKWLKILMGLNGASVIHGLRLGFSELVNDAFAGFSTAHPMQERVTDVF
jgi:hypothetical protein